MRSHLVFWCASVLSLFAAAQQTRPLPVDAALKTATFAELLPISVSPDGRLLAYTVRDNQRARAVDSATTNRTGIRDLETGTDIWISDLVSGTAKSLTGGHFDNFLPAWSPDGHYLAFISDRDGSSRAELWIWDSKLDSLRRLSNKTINTSQIEWTPDSQEVVVTVPPDDLAAISNRGAALGQADRQTSGDREQARVSVFRAGERDAPGKEENHQADAWDLDWARRSLVIFDVPSGKTQTLLHNLRIAQFAISPDASHIAYTSTTRFESAGSQQILYDLRTVAIASREQRTWTRDIRLGFNGLFSWAPDGRSLAYRTYGPGEKTFDCYVVSLADGVSRNISKLQAMVPSQGLVSENTLWSADSKFVYFTSAGALWRASVEHARAFLVARIPARQIKSLIPQSPNTLWMTNGGASTVVLTRDDAGKQDGWYEVDLKTGGSDRLLEDRQCYTCSRVQDPVPLPKDFRRILYFSEDAGHSDDLWLAASDFKTRRQVTHLNPQFEDYRMGSARLVHWLSDDGEPLQGVLLLPPGFEQDRKYPLVVWVYGGVLLSNFLDHFGTVGPGPLNMQLLATRGYAVFLPDSPQHLGSPMLDLAKTVLPGISKLVEMGVADPERIGIMGHSNGGYSVLGLIVETNRFKAAVELSGMADLMANYGEMDQSGSAFATSYLEHGLDGLGGTPWQVPTRYIENSPIFYLDRVKTPLLLVHGTADESVEPFLGDEAYVAMRRLGKEAEYVKYEGEPHSPIYWTFASQRDLCDRIISWFNGHLGTQSPERESSK